ncbi:MAG: hypothetical protein M1818_003867 [Claussenomyces sp. TS43310]|nr:MAG: hypothetical protein M1818_003867 [Claussenomyces sp. TS43310]
MELRNAAMIGCGSMGGGMALLFAEQGVQMSCQDPSAAAVEALMASAREQNISPVPTKHEDYEDLCASLDSPKVIFFSLPHGTVGDGVVEGLQPYLSKGDIIVDCSNENWNNTQRRQGKLVSQGVYYIGMGVSGGYQAARRGPSLCPGGEEKALDLLMPFFEKVAAKDARGRPCVGKAGQGGAGHYIKMIHNGIEHGMMSAISEAWSFMNTHMDMKYDEIGEVFERWSSEGELKNMFLVKTGAEICERKNEGGSHVLGEVQDKVVQDIDGTEGTGIWSNVEATHQHVPAPTLSTAHYLRVVSADRGQREHVKSTFHGSFPTSKIQMKDDAEKAALIEDLRWAVYSACLASYVQGLSIIDVADRQNRWQVDYSIITQIWRNGCIIRADHIADLLESIFRGPHGRDSDRNLLYEPAVAEELKRSFPSLRRMVLRGVESNAVIPSISATLEYLKYSGNLQLPTQFYEAELDYFGKHMYDKKGEGPGKPETGSHHFEWKKA